MIQKDRRLLILGIALFFMFVLWGVDRYNLVRDIRHERWSSREKLAEKDAMLKIMEEKAHDIQKKLDKLLLEQAKKNREKLPPDAPPGQVIFDLEQLPRIEEEPNRQTLSAQEEAIEKELAEIERRYEEEGRKAQEEEGAQPNP